MQYGDEESLGQPAGSHRIRHGKNLSHIGAVLLLAGVVPAAASAQQRASATPLVLDEVTVVDVVQGKLLPAQRVVIVGNRIQTVGAARAVEIPTGAQVVEARGKYLIPGLWEMHAHVDLQSRDVEQIDSLNRANYPRFVAHGVTGLREMSQRFPGGPDSFRVWQQEIMTGARVGPRMVGPSVDVISSLSPYGGGEGILTVSAPEDAGPLVDSLKAAGMAFLKMHDDLMPADLYFALLRETRRAGLPLVGHTPFAVTDVEIADSGQRSVEHVNELRSRRPRPIVDRSDTGAVRAPLLRSRVSAPSTPSLPVVLDYRSGTRHPSQPGADGLIRVPDARWLTRPRFGGSLSAPS